MHLQANSASQLLVLIIIIIIRKFITRTSNDMCSTPCWIPASITAPPNSSTVSYCKTLNVSVPFILQISWAKQNRKIKGCDQLQAKIGQNYTVFRIVWFKYAKMKGAKIILQAKSSTFRAAKLKGFTVCYCFNESTRLLSPLACIQPPHSMNACFKPPHVHENPYVCINYVCINYKHYVNVTSIFVISL